MNAEERSEEVSHRENWIGSNPFANDVCSSCQFVPLCKGGCPKNLLEYGEQGLAPTCEYWEKNFSQLVHQAAREIACAS